MFSWMTFWQAVAPSMFLTLTVGLGGIVLRLQAYGDRIVQLEKQTSENKGRIETMAETVNSIKNTLTEINVKLGFMSEATKELLVTQRKESPGRLVGSDR